MSAHQRFCLSVIAVLVLVGLVLALIFATHMALFVLAIIAGYIIFVFLIMGALGL